MGESTAMRNSNDSQINPKWMVLLSELSVRMSKLQNKIYKLGAMEHTSSALEQLNELTTDLDKISQVFREEQFYIARNGNLLSLPDDCTVDYDQERTIVSVPIWYLGTSSGNSYPVSFHNNTPYVRDNDFWNTIAGAIARDEKTIGHRMKINFTFYTQGVAVEYVNHPNIAVILDSFAANGLIPPDAPRDVTVYLNWTSASRGSSERVEIRLH